MYQAAERGLTVSKPFGDSAPYDVIVDNGKRLLRVQVRCTHVPNSRCFRVSTRLHGDSRSFTPDDIDFLVAWVVPYNAWYIVPARALPTNELKLFPHVPNSTSRTERYREAWRLLGAKAETEPSLAGVERYKKSWLPPSASGPAPAPNSASHTLASAAAPRRRRKRKRNGAKIP